jgi:hypothetical protein
MNLKILFVQVERRIVEDHTPAQGLVHMRRKGKQDSERAGDGEEEVRTTTNGQPKTRTW